VLTHTPNQTILSELQRVYGKDVTLLGVIEKLIAAFDGGRTESVDLLRLERLRNTGNVDSVRALIEGGEYLSEKKIVQMPGIHHKTIKPVVRDDLNMCKVRSM
jgi:hypothetical protein